METAWPAVAYDSWRATCDTLHAHTQLLGKLAARLAPPGWDMAIADSAEAAPIV